MLKILLILVSITTTSLKANENSKEIDKYFLNLLDQHDFSGSVLVKKNNKIIFEKSYGYANHDHKILNTSLTRYEIASISKQFVAALILKLQDENKLKVTDAACTHLTDCPDHWKKITIHHLLSHTSGVPVYYDSVNEHFNYPEIDYQRFNSFTSQQLVDIYKKAPLSFEPGASFEYSNPAYTVLTLIIESVTNLTFKDAFRTILAVPLKLESTGIVDVSEIVSNRAEGYFYSEDILFRRPFWDPSLATGAGDVYSTVHDLMKWQTVLTDGTFISKDSWSLMSKPGVNNFGYGLVIQKAHGQRIIWHNGSVLGFSSESAYYPDIDLRIVILSNLHKAGRHSEGLDIAKILIK